MTYVNLLKNLFKNILLLCIKRSSNDSLMEEGWGLVIIIHLEQISQCGLLPFLLILLLRVWKVFSRYTIYIKDA